MDCSHVTNSLLSIELKMEVRQEATMNKDDHQDCHDQKKKKRSGAAGSTNNTGCASKTCQVDKCTADLGDVKQYYRRHRVCEHHSKAQVVMVGGLRQRYCQQCSRFHELFEFDEAKRSCRRRLAGHNERRRKSTTTDAQSEGTSSTNKGT